MAAKDYNHAEIEKKWQQKWQEQQLYKTDNQVDGKENFYTLFEFPYPSGNLHVGHWYAFGPTDVIARYHRMNGKNVLFPVGFDSFGLPAENAAIKRGLDPREWTYKNIEIMTNQIKSMGTSVDWSREVKTSDPEYYKWTQYIFTQFLEKGLAYESEQEVNYCPGCKTVVANEQVVNGQCERCDSQIEKRTQKQWTLRITDYAEELLNDLDGLDWPEEIKAAQRAWIGKSEGANFEFEVANTNKKVKVFTTRPDTFYGVTYLVVAPEHEMISSLNENITNYEAVEDYIKTAQSKTDVQRQEAKEKTGVKLEGITANHPATGEKLPIFVADYVLGSYGTGAIMAVPAHDERDNEFAKKFDLPIVNVVNKIFTFSIKEQFDDFIDTNPDIHNNSDKLEIRLPDILGWKSIKYPNRHKTFSFKTKTELVNSSRYNNKTSEEAGQKIAEEFGEVATTYRLRDWSVGRQRYWGCPIPVVYSPEGKAKAVPLEHLPWTLPDDVDHTPDGTAPLDRSSKLKKRTEEIFGEGWTPATDTMDTFVDSSWYYVRYTDAGNDNSLASSDLQKVWLPVDFYSGGAEHTTMHLLYARFFYKAMRDCGLVVGDEPFKNRMNRSLILGPDGNKMSKSKGNVIDPDIQVNNVGADAVRMYLCFMGPYNEVSYYPWDPNGLVGVRKFLERVNGLGEFVTSKENKDIEIALHKAIKGVTESIEQKKLNTGVSALMILSNEIEKQKQVTETQLRTMSQLLAPYAPHLAEELWQHYDGTGSVHESMWPRYDKELLRTDSVVIPVQVNGKKIGQIRAPRDAAQDLVEKLAKSDTRLKLKITGEAKKVIYVKNRILNLVIDKNA